MLAATIVPTHYLGYTDKKPYHMALAHLIGKDEVYTEFYKEQAKNGAFVILDNGLIEGDQRPITELLSKAIKIGAQELILPDVFKNLSDTLDLGMSALEYIQAQNTDIRIMAVPQGNSIEEWIECAKLMLEWPIHTLGIPKVLTKLGGRDARLNVLQVLKETIEKAQVDIHLLGCWSNPIECTMIHNAAEHGLIPQVRGIDSAIAYVYAREGWLISQGPRPTGEIHFNAKDADRDKLARNIEIWEQACNPQVDMLSIS